MSLEFEELVEICKAEAIAFKLFPTEQSSWRYFCRKFSEKFHTPLKEVFEMDPEMVILNVYESQLEDLTIEDKIDQIMEQIYTIEDPNYESQKEEDLEDFIRQAELEEEERIAKGEGLKIRSQKNRFNPSKKDPDTPKDLPKEGFVDFSHFETEEQ